MLLRMGTRSAELAAPVRMHRLLTTASLAVKPVRRAVEALQSPKPRGTKIGAMALPMAASML